MVETRSFTAARRHKRQAASLEVEQFNAQPRLGRIRRLSTSTLIAKPTRMDGQGRDGTQMHEQASDRQSLADWQQDAYSPGVHCLARSSHAFPTPAETTWFRTKTPLIVSPIDPQHPAVGIYESRASDIVRACKSLDWAAFGLYHLGYDNQFETHPVTIFVRAFMENSTVVNAQKAVSSIIEILEEEQLHNVAVHVAGFSAPSVPAVSPTHHQYAYTDGPSVGQSLGLADSDDSGSICAFLEIMQSDGTKIYAALTCHHVIAEANLSGDQGRPFVRSVGGAKHHICSPSATDHRIFIESCETKRDELARILIRLSTKELTAGTLNPSDQIRKARATQSINDLEKKINAAKDYRAVVPSVGHLLLSSGNTRTAVGESLPDWALVQLSIEAEGLGNGYPAAAGERASEILVTLAARNLATSEPEVVEDNLVRERTYNLPPARPLSTLAGQNVFLYGRISGLTVGRLNGAKDRVQVTVQLGGGVTTTICSEEYLVLDFLRHNVTEDKIPTFAKPGDSGAPVKNEDGELVGMLGGVGMVQQTGYLSCYVYPIELIVGEVTKSLETSLGMQGVSCKLL